MILFRPERCWPDLDAHQRQVLGLAMYLDQQAPAVDAYKPRDQHGREVVPHLGWTLDEIADLMGADPDYVAIVWYWFAQEGIVDVQ